MFNTNDPSGQATAWTPQTSTVQPTEHDLMGGASAVSIDTFNQWMRAQPWYQQILTQYGGNAKSDAAKTAITRAAQAAGAKIDESNMEVDTTGNFREQGHKLRNTLIVAGMAGAALATMGAAGVFGGAAAASAGGGSGIEGAATLGLADASGIGGATALGTGAAATAAGTVGATAAGTGAAAAAIPPAAAADAASGMSVAGLLAKYGPTIASALAAGAKSSAAGQVQQTGAQQTQDYLTLAIEKQKQDAQNNAYRNAIKSGVAMNTKDFSFSPIPGITYTPPNGGSRPSAIGAQGMDAAKTMNQKALEELLHPSTADATPLPTQGPMQTVGGNLAAGLGIASTIAPLFMPKPAPTTTPLPSTQANGSFTGWPQPVPMSGNQF